ncbi:hypothetical protein D9615_004911 [Tricholomella constricta]|uniref:DNA 3'-5' helicase n=1 Tax=Tricholomella constricta TaxID=117010 RepID=A0A8H5HH32_9AGAR|nr:hypothetical protein D9615_004911 [Tricholomella constricta]
MSAEADTAPHSWRSIEGRTRIRGIMEGLMPQWRNGPREFQVDVWANILDKIAVLLIAHTGGGKTAAFWGPVLIMQHLLQFAIPGVPAPPSKPVGIIVTPLVELGNNHAREINQLGIGTVAVNAETVREAVAEGRNLYSEVRHCKWSMVLISPERLLTPELDGVLRDECFRKNVVLLGVDEAHVLNPWGEGFRPAYKQINALRRRLPTHCVLVAVTATLSPGKDYDSLCGALDLKPGRFHCVRLSSERVNVRPVLVELRHTLTGWDFPDIKWVFSTPGIKVIVYCATLDLQMRVALYGWNQYEIGPARLEKVRLWNSMTSPTYNERTLDLFHHNPETRVIVASVAFGLGMNIRIITDSINLGIPDTVEALVQQNGRAGRDLEMDAHGWTYIESAVVLSVREDLDEGAVVGFEDGILPKKKKARSKGRSRRVVEAKMKRLVSAHLQGLCIIAELNVILGNPGVNTELSCEAAGRRLPCSSCQPFWNNPAPAPMPPGYVVPVTPLSASSRRPRSLTKKQRAHAHAHLMYFAEKRTLVKDTACSRYAPTAEFWTGTNLDLILDNLHLLNAKEGLDAMLSKWQYLTDDGNMLHLLINGLNAQYDALYLKAKATQARRAAATRAAKKGERAANSRAHAYQQTRPFYYSNPRPSISSHLMLDRKRRRLHRKFVLVS